MDRGVHIGGRSRGNVIITSDNVVVDENTPRDENGNLIIGEGVTIGGKKVSPTVTPDETSDETENRGTVIEGDAVGRVINTGKNNRIG